MYKYIGLLFIIIFLVPACSIKRVSTDDLDLLTDLILENSINISNINAVGYKYYLPRGVSQFDNTDFNEKLYTNKNIYILFIDVINYYHNKRVDYEINENAYFSKILGYNNNYGYLEINKINDKYFIEMMYNYAKIETYIYEKDIIDTVINLCYILSSIKFNDNIINIMFEENILNFDEQIFDIFKPKREEGKFLDYIKEYEYYQKEEEIIFFD